MGYHSAHAQLGARSFLVFQRRTRVWMWAIWSDVAAAPSVEEVRTIFKALDMPQPAPLYKLLRRVVSDTRARQTINEREQDVLEGVVQQNRPLQRLEAEELTDLVVDISKSAGRALWCIGATPYALPPSLLHWRRQQRALGARETVALQGIWLREFSALESWCQSGKRSRALMDMAGNAFH